MPRAPADRRAKAELLSALAAIPPGRVASVAMIAESVAAPVAVVTRLLANLTDDERQIVPWHRVVAKGGAIGWGAHRETQFARLLREGVAVSPAGIVQDMARVAVESLAPEARPAETAHQPQPPPPWRGMKDKPG